MRGKPHKVVVLLGCRRTAALAAWTSTVPALASAVVSSDLRSLRALCEALRPPMLLLDVEFAGVDALGVVEDFRRASTSTRILIVGEAGGDDDELALFRAGVRGILSHAAAPALVERAIEAVGRGELWIRRHLTGRLFDEAGLSRAPPVRPVRAPRARLERLTAREREIAILVSRGESNKRIAQELSITERTVKAHLTEVFRKSGVPDRVKLALLISGRAES